MSNLSQNREIQYLSSQLIRQKFLDFFEKKKNHRLVPSSSLVPYNDTTLLFTNSGMVQFKDVFSGKEKRDYKRAVTSQKCIRAGGKHNDLENVGYTARHHTFFEMLGNFSFGDYFKEDAIRFAWEFLTDELQIPAERLWVSVYLDDDEAVEIWTKKIGFPINRISRCDEDNFWQMGDTGPCGPCTEIFFDHGEHIKGGPPGSKDEDGDRYTEIWNLVFTQFNRTKDGKLEKLPKPSVDTGMGLERVSAVLQSVTNNYHTDLFIPIIDFASQKLGVSKEHPSLKVLADHIRSCSFLIADGVYPGNESRNYVLRRIIRRAIRHAHKLGANNPNNTKENLFFYQLVEPLVQVMADAYPELKDKQSQIEEVLKGEEMQFKQTLEIGMKLLNQEIEKKPQNIASEICFKLYDTHGFPIDLTADIAREHNLVVDLKGFNALMNQQKIKSKQSSSRFKSDDLKLVLDLKESTEFVGYEQFEFDSQLQAIILNNHKVNQIDASQSANQLALVLDNTPFYPESGGQVADDGQFQKINKNGEIEALFEVQDTQKYADAILHFGQLISGTIQVGDRLKTSINQGSRIETTKHHSATHLLQAALIEVLGNHIEQKGSLVTSDKLRFDFSHPHALKSDEIERIEFLVNQQILQAVSSKAEIMPKEDALKIGAKAMFGEKYGETVRVLSIGKNSQNQPFSLEFCGGTHVKNTAQIGLFKIISESSISSGIRRIEAVCGQKAIELFNTYQKILTNNSKFIQAPIEKQTEQISQLQDKLKSLTKEMELANQKLSSYQLADLVKQAERITSRFHLKPISILTAIVNWDKKTLMNAMDYLKNKLNPAIIVLATKDNLSQRVHLFCAVSTDIKKEFQANQLIQKFTKALAGKGGGRDDMAQAGLVDKQNQLEKLFIQFKKELKKELARELKKRT